MDRLDMNISRAYKEICMNTHASEEFNEKVSAMTEMKIRKPRPVVKIAAALVAAVIMVTLCAMMVSAARTEYAPIMINGEKQKARYVDFGTGTYMVEYEANNTAYTAFITGEYDKTRDTLYFVDCGDYFLASTDPEPKLNLYEDIDKSKYAELKDVDGEKTLCVKDDAGINNIVFTYDEADGKADGIQNVGGDSKTLDVYTLLPNGSVVNTVKENNIGLLKMFGYDSNKFFNDLYEMLDSNK